MKKGKRTKCWERGMQNWTVWMELDSNPITLQLSTFYALALMMSMNSGFREPLPTMKPSMSFWAASSLQVSPLTEPEKKKRCVRRDQRGTQSKTATQHSTDLRRWSLQSWLPPQTRCSSATPSLWHESAAPDISHRRHYVRNGKHNMLNIQWFVIFTCWGEAAFPVPMAHPAS